MEHMTYAMLAKGPVSAPSTRLGRPPPAPPRTPVRLSPRNSAPSFRRTVRRAASPNTARASRKTNVFRERKPMIANFNPRCAWGAPLHVFREYLKSGRFLHACSYIFSAHVVKISDSGHSRSGHQVTSSDLTSEKV